MGEKDITEKLLEDYNDVFADIVNVLLFDGCEVVKEDSLENASVHSQYKADDGKVHELERDVAKYWKDGEVMLAIYGIENQTAIDKLMPFRVIGYDGASYRSQLSAGNKNIVPVITIVLYFGKERWTAPKKLKEALIIPPTLDKYVSDYSINVFEISWLPYERIRKFKSDFRLVADFFIKRRVNPKYSSKDKTKIRHIEEVLKLMSAFTGDKRYESILSSPEAKEVNNMCEVADYLWNGGKAEGLAEGLAEGIAKGHIEALFSLVQDGDLAIEKAADKINLSIPEFKKKMNEAGFKIPEKI